MTSSNETHVKGSLCHEKSTAPVLEESNNVPTRVTNADTTRRGLKARHAQMIALGGTIGTGLFVGSGGQLARGGPAFIVVAYILLAIFVYFVLTAISEVAVYLPVNGGTMSYIGHRYVSNSLGFAMGYLYWYSLGILVPYEITAAAVVIDYWNSPINIAVWITIFIVVIVGLNLLPVSFYGESEFWFASLKVLLLLGLFILTIILFWGGGPDQHGILGFHYWKDPGATNVYLETGTTGRFLAFLITLVSGAFAFTFAPELLIVCSAEMENPRRNLPKAANIYFFRLVFFYVGCVFAIGLIWVGAKASAFTVGIQNAGIKVLPSIINAVILMSAWSSGNSFLYMSSRSLYSLAVAGNAPKMFARCSKRGVPYPAVIASSLFCALAYLNCANTSAVVFEWMACKAQGITGRDLPYHSFLQPWGAWAALVFFTFLLLINGFNVFWPEYWSASSFLTAYIGLPIFLAIYLTHRMIYRSDKWAFAPDQVDLTTGLDEALAQDNPNPEKKGWKALLRRAFT
ncbi:AAT family amino acid transporter, variant [Exophiala viscosa]|uniref:AAT family amino acid transporter, variant n=1 Tax=Exophiala viscosa TaxID=2486360 RepID=UPI002193BA83|nr:AAT family amino acid transporter, variant [Exophiala viscosa]